MALITCPECGQQVSDTAKSCPHCGYVLKKTINVNFSGGAQKAGDAVKDLKGMKFDNPFETIDFRKWKSAFASRKFWFYLIVILVVLLMTIISKGFGYSLIFLIPTLALLLRAVAEGIIDKEYPDSSRSFKTVMQYDDLVVFMLVLPFKGGMQAILLALAAALSVIALMKMASFMRNATATRTCPECRHEIEAGQQECPYCSYVDVPSGVPAGNKSHYVAAAACLVVLLIGGLVLQKQLPSKCNKLEGQLAAISQSMSSSSNSSSSGSKQKTWTCHKCGQQNVGSSRPPSGNYCPGRDNPSLGHDWWEQY